MHDTCFRYFLKYLDYLNGVSKRTRVDVEERGGKMGGSDVIGTRQGDQRVKLV